MNVNVVNGVAFGAAFQSPIAKKKILLHVNQQRKKEKLNIKNILKGITILILKQNI